MLQTEKEPAEGCLGMHDKPKTPEKMSKLVQQIPFRIRISTLYRPCTLFCNFRKLFII